MASAVTTTCLSLPPTPRSRFPFKSSSLDLPRAAPPKKICSVQPLVFPIISFSPKVREPRVLVPVARSLGGCALKKNELHSDLTKRGGRSLLYKYWRQQAMQGEKENEGQISHEELYKVMKILVSILSFISVDGDPNKGLLEERCESILHYILYNFGAHHSPEEYAPYLARLIMKYSDIRERQQRVRELEFQEFCLRGKVLSLVRPCWCCLKWVAAFLAGGFFYLLLFSALVSYRCTATPNPSAPELYFNLGVQTALQNLHKIIRT